MAVNSSDMACLTCMFLSDEVVQPEVEWGSSRDGMGNASGECASVQSLPGKLFSNLVMNTS